MGGKQKADWRRSRLGTDLVAGVFAKGRRVLTLSFQTPRLAWLMMRVVRSRRSMMCRCLLHRQWVLRRGLPYYGLWFQFNWAIGFDGEVLLSVLWVDMQDIINLGG